MKGYDNMLLITVLKYLKLYNGSKHTNLTTHHHLKLDKAILLIDSVLKDLDKQGYYKEWKKWKTRLKKAWKHM